MSDYPLESFVFYRSFRDAIAEMSDENKLATLLAICDYALYGREPKLKDAMSRAVFTVARPSIDANRDRRNNGKKGGRPKKETNGLDEKNHRFSKTESTETESVSETEAETNAAKPPCVPRFSPPSLSEIEKYCRARGNTVDAQSFFDFYSAKNWMIGRNKMRDWKAAIRTWERRGEKKENQGGQVDDYWA